MSPQFDNDNRCTAAVSWKLNGNQQRVSSQKSGLQNRRLLWRRLMVVLASLFLFVPDASSQELEVLYPVAGIFCATASQLRDVAAKLNQGVPEQFAVVAGGGEYQCVFHFGVSHRNVRNPTIIGRMLVQGKPMLLCKAELVEVVLGQASHRISKEGEVDLPTYFLQKVSADAICLEAI